MGTILVFPAATTQHKSARALDGGQAYAGNVVILPVVRIERHADVPTTETPEQKTSRRGRRRRVRS